MTIVVPVIAVLIVAIIIWATISVFKNFNKEYKQQEKKDSKFSNTMVVNGEVIHLSEEEIKELEDKEFKDKEEKFHRDKEYLLNRIQNDINKSDDFFKKKVLQSIIKRPIENEADLNRMKFVYNNGNLRSSEEVEHYDKYVSTEEKRKNFNNERHTINTIAFLIPFLIGFFIGFVIWEFEPFFGIPTGFLIGCLLGFIGMLIGYKVNLSKAQEYCINDEDPRVMDEKRKLGVGIASGITGGVIIGRHAKNAVKDVANVDSWKEMQ